MNTTNFTSADDSDLWLKNKQKLGTNWYYYHTPIEYQWTKENFRMPHEVNDTDWSNYIYFSGCSYSIGLGVEYEKTYPFLVSKENNCDYVNTALSGASVERVLQNTVEFLSECKKFPKLIIINWPEIARTSWWEDDGSVGIYMPKYYVGQWKRSYEEFITHELHMFNRFAHIRKTIKLICNSLTIPLLEISTALTFSPSTHKVFDGVTEMPSFHKKIDFSNNDDLSKMHYHWARDYGFHDGGHPGWKHHTNVANYIKNWIENYEN